MAVFTIPPQLGEGSAGRTQRLPASLFKELKALLPGSVTPAWVGGHWFVPGPHNPRGPPPLACLFSREAGSRLSGILELLSLPSKKTLNIHWVFPEATGSTSKAAAPLAACSGDPIPSPHPSPSHTDCPSAPRPPCCPHTGGLRFWSQCRPQWPALPALAAEGQALGASL